MNLGKSKLQFGTLLHATVPSNNDMNMLQRWKKKSDTLITGGGVRKSLLFSVKSSTRSVADMMISFMGKPFCESELPL